MTPPRARLSLPAAVILLALATHSLCAPAELSHDSGVLKLKRTGAGAGPAVRSDSRRELNKRQGLFSALAGDTTTSAAAADASAVSTTPAAATSTSAAAAATTSAAASAASSAAASSAAPSAATSAGQDPSSAVAPSAATTSAAAASSTTSAAPTSDTATSATKTSTPVSSALSSGLSSGTVSSSSTTSSASTSATAGAKKDDSSSTGKTWGIVGGVAGGVIAVVGIVFVAWKCSQQRFSSIEDGPDIRWPELQADAATTLNPSATHRTGGAGFEMGERRASDEWDANAAFGGERQSMMGYGGESQHYAASAYDPYGAPQQGYTPNMYPPQQQGQYFDPYGQPAFANSQASYHSGAPPYAGGSPYADEEKEDMARAGTPVGPRGDGRTASQAELDQITLQGRQGGNPPSRQGTAFSEKGY